MGEIPDGGGVDEHRFEWVYGGKFIRDFHFVKSENPLYEGEAIYVLNEERKTVVFWYWSNMGFYTEGTAVPEEDARTFSLRFFAEILLIMPCRSSHFP